MLRSLSLSLLLAALLVAPPAAADPKADMQANCVDIAKYLDMGDFDDLWRLSQADADALYGRVMGCMKALAASGLNEDAEVELQGFKKAGKLWIGKVSKATETCVRVGGWAYDLKKGGKLHWAAVAKDKLGDEKYAEQMKEIADACIAFAGELKKNTEIADLRFSLNPENALLMARSVQSVFCDDLRQKAIKYLNDRPDSVSPERLELATKTRPGAITEELVRKSEPEPGVETVKPMKPDWCPGGRIDAAGAYEAKRFNELVKNQGDFSEDHLREIALYACANPDDPIWQRQIAYWRQDWLNAVRTSEAEDRAALKLRANVKAFDQQWSDACDVANAMPDRTGEQKAQKSALRYVLACDRSNSPLYFPSVNASISPALDIGWWVDSQPEVKSHLLTAAFLKSCYIDGRKGGDGGRIRCAVMGREDGPALDVDKALAEAAAMKLTNDYARIRVRELVKSAKADQAYFDSEYQRIIKEKDPALLKLMVDVPNQAYARWKDHYAANRAFHDRRLALDAKIFDPDADMKGSTREAHTLLLEVLQKGKLDSLEALPLMAFDPVVSPFVYTLVKCARQEGAMSLELGFSRMFKGVPNDFRGPRFAAYSVLYASLVDQERSRKLFFETGYMKPPVFPPYDAKVAWGEGEKNEIKGQAGQVVKIVKGPGAGQVTVHFKASTYVADLMECHPTNKINQILPDGRIVYDQDCKKLGEEVRKSVPEPARLPEAVSKLIKPGMFLTFDFDKGKGSYTGGEDEGFPAQLYADKELKKLVLYHGIPVRK